MASSIANMPATAIARQNVAVYNRAGKPLNVCLLVYEGLCPVEYGIAATVFTKFSPKSSPWYSLKTIIAHGGLPANAMMNADSDLTALANADLILVPGWWDMAKPVPAALCDALIAANARGARMATMGAGIGILAQCGVLKGKRVTTHWREVDALQMRYPDIKVDANVMFVEDGNIVSSAGGMSGMDMCVHIVRSDYGSAIANTVARGLVMPMALQNNENGTDANHISRPIARAFQGNIAPLLDKIRESISEDWGIERMAHESRSSARTLQRRFKDATGHSPHMWLTIERIELAKDLLETTGMHIQQIADITGLKTPETFRHHFKRLTGVSPTRFRAKFNDGSV